ncbi:MAG: ArgE/DapE family deacylase [Lentisphaerae bacterium]|nr:ArgE/DapE family deacylase [Lentisphaerota bacterium]
MMNTKETTTLDSAQAILTRLVQCPSVNPAGREPIAPPYGEGRMAALLSEQLKDMGGEVRTDEVLPGRLNVWSRFAGRDRSRTILLDAHSDTVSHLHMSVDPFGAEVREGRLFGRGACDTKGPMAAMLLALESAVRSGRLAHDVIFAATCDEENGGRGARHLVTRGLQADFAISAEPTELQLVWRHKGIQRGRITLHGMAAHSSTPARGHNAIYPAARLVGQLEAMAAALSAGKSDAELGTATLAVTTMHGGTAANIIPDSCVLDVDRRVLPSEDIDAIRLAIEELVHRACAADPWCTPSIDWTQHYPSLGSSPTAPALLALETALRTVTGTAQRSVAAYGTNAGFYAQAGIPSVVFGPGSIADAHTAAESISLAEVVSAAKVIEQFLCTPIVDTQ